jgi:hypothetical protein
MKQAERQRWAARVQDQLRQEVPAGADVIMLAGQRYREGLMSFLKERGHDIVVPLEGLPFGKQLQFLRAEMERR